MSTDRISNLQVPFTKPQHVGYCLSCYGDDGPIYSIPLDATTETLLGILDRENVINAEPLTKAEFAAVFPHVIGAAELCWYDDFESLVQGQNLPLSWKDY